MYKTTSLLGEKIRKAAETNLTDKKKHILILFELDQQFCSDKGQFIRNISKYSSNLTTFHWTAED